MRQGTRLFKLSKQLDTLVDIDMCSQYSGYIAGICLSKYIEFQQQCTIEVDIETQTITRLPAVEQLAHGKAKFVSLNNNIVIAIGSKVYFIDLQEKKEGEQPFIVRLVANCPEEINTPVPIVLTGKQLGFALEDELYIYDCHL